MVKLVKGLFGSSSQEKLLKKQQADLDAVDAGQRRLREGGRGLLAFVEDQITNLGGGNPALSRYLGGG